MNKVLSLVLVLVLCVAMSAIAESPVAASVAAPVVVATYPAVDLRSDPTAAAEVAAQLSAMETQGREAYFGQDVANLIDAVSNGNLVAIDALTLSGYEASMGDVTVTITTPNLQTLTKDQKVAVVIAVPNGVDKGITTYDYAVFEGIADGNGSVQTTLPADCLTLMGAAGAMVYIFA